MDSIHQHIKKILTSLGCPSDQADELIQEHAKECPNAQPRTEESVFDQLICSCANDRRISGIQNYNEALIKLTRAAQSDDELRQALYTVADKMLQYFPNIPE